MDTNTIGSMHDTCLEKYDMIAALYLKGTVSKSTSRRSINGQTYFLVVEN